MKLRIISFCIVSVLVLSCVFPSFATNNVDALENTTSNLENELSNLNNELDALSTELDIITALIQDTFSELETTKEELAIAKGMEQAQYEAMTLRIKYMYENGSNSFLEILLTSRSMAEFVNRAEYVAAITEYDRAMLDELSKTTASIAEKEQELIEKQEYLDSLQEDLDEKEQTLHAKISETSRDLSAYTAKLEAAQEEARKAEEALKEEIIPVIPEKPMEEPSVETGEETYDAPPESDDAEEDTSVSIEVSASDTELLAALIECEAGTSDYEGMLAVGSVVINRMNSRYYPDTLRGVIYQSGQFPPALNGAVEKVLLRGVHANCAAAAQDALAGKNNVGDCLQFRSVNSGHTGTIIGNNVFF